MPSERWKMRIHIVKYNYQEYAADRNNRRTDLLDGRTAYKIDKDIYGKKERNK